MATVMLMLMVVLLAIAATPWIGTMGHGVHHTDLMAGDEGED